MAILGSAKAAVKETLAAFDIENPNRNVIRDAWNRLHALPGGKRLFSRAIGYAARYTGTISPRVLTLERQRCVIEMDDTPLVRNHLRSVHAVALANLAEMAGNLSLVYTMPDDARFIVAGLNMEYLKKARGTITAEGTSPDITSNARQEYDVHVSMRDREGNEVARCTLKTLVGPKPGAESNRRAE